MADQLYLSVWFPDFQLSALPAKLASVMRQFATISGSDRVAAAAAYPISFSEAPTYQRVFVDDARSDTGTDARIDHAVSEATEQLHSDTAYEFELRWKLWTPDFGFGSREPDADDPARLDTLWRPEPASVKVIGFGPEFDDAAFEQNGHIRVDFGLDYPWVLDDADGEDEEDSVPLKLRRSLDPHSPPPARDAGNVIAFPTGDSVREESTETSDAAQYIQRNVEMLLAFTLSVEKHCGISSRLLWTESGTPLAEKLIARLQRLT